jgi:type II secretory pathway component PulM
MKKLIARWLPQQEKYLKKLQLQKKQALAGWQRLAPGKKYAFISGSSLLLFFLFYACLWSPLLLQLDGLRTQIRQDKATLLWMEAAGHKIKSLQKKSPQQLAKSLPLQLIQLQNALKQAPLNAAPRHLSVVGTDKIHCVFEKVDFDSFIAWLTAFSQQESFTLEEAHLERLNNHGLVHASLLLRVD